jgi:hypothetical protein
MTEVLSHYQQERGGGQGLEESADGVEQVRGNGPEPFGVWPIEGPKVTAAGDTDL